MRRETYTVRKKMSSLGNNDAEKKALLSLQMLSSEAHLGYTGTPVG
jgi:hypothetical protein